MGARESSSKESGSGDFVPQKLKPFVNWCLNFDVLCDNYCAMHIALG